MSLQEVLAGVQGALQRITSAIPEDQRGHVAEDLRLLATVCSFIASTLRAQDALEKSAAGVRPAEGTPAEQPHQPAPTEPQKPAEPGTSLPPGPMTPQRRRQ